MKKFKYFLPIIPFMIFLLLLILVVCNKTDSFDQNISNHIYNIRGHKGNGLYYFSRIITECGYFYVAIAVILLAGLLLKWKYKFFVLGIGTLLTAGLNSIIKLVIDRTRPDEAMQWMHESSSSFPSGHSVTSMFLYSMLLYIIIKTSNNKKIRVIAMIVCPLIILIVGGSRLILGMHYFTDILAGYMLGLTMFFIGMNVYDYIGEEKTKNESSKKTEEQ